MTNTPNPDVFINLVLDRSGSMHSIAKPTVEGVNAFLDEQRQQEGQAFLSLTLFDHQFVTPFVGEALGEVPPLGSEGNLYQPRGGTALLDAVGTAVKGAEGWLAAHPDFTGKTVVVVVTDGHENQSQEWHLSHPPKDGDDRDIGHLITHTQGLGWEWVFLGSGSDWLEKNLGHVVAAERFASFTGDAANNRAAYRGVSKGLSMSRCMVGASFVAPKVASDGSIIDS